MKEADRTLTAVDTNNLINRAAHISKKKVLRGIPELRT